MRESQIRQPNNSEQNQTQSYRLDYTNMTDAHLIPVTQLSQLPFDDSDVKTHGLFKGRQRGEPWIFLPHWEGISVSEGNGRGYAVLCTICSPVLCTKAVIVTSLFFLLRANAGTELMDSFQIQGYDVLASFAFISVKILRLTIRIILNWERNVTWTPG